MMMAPLMGLVVLLVAGGALAGGEGDCYKYHACTECVVQPHCGWCPTASSCWSGGTDGPTNPRQFCAADDWNFDECKAIRLQDGQRFSVKDPKGGFYDYFELGLIYPGQDVTVAVDNGAASSNRKLYASQTVSLPRSNNHEWEGKDKGSLLELRLGSSDGLDYTKPLFLSVLNDVSLSYSILGQMAAPSSGGELQGCSFDVTNTTFDGPSGLVATSAISQLCTKTSRSADAFLQRLVNEPSPLTGWEMVGAVAVDVYKGLFKTAINLTQTKGYQTLTVTASSPYPYHGPRVMTVWRDRSTVAAPSPRPRRRDVALATGGCSGSPNPGWIIVGHSASIDERVQFWITTVFNQYLCGSKDAPQWDWDTVRSLGIYDVFWSSYYPQQNFAGFRWSIKSAVSLDDPEVHWVWASQGDDDWGPGLYLVLESVPVIPGDVSLSHEELVVSE
jgi:hypothetical protein